MRKKEPESCKINSEKETNSLGWKILEIQSPRFRKQPLGIWEKRKKTERERRIEESIQFLAILILREHSNWSKATTLLGTQIQELRLLFLHPLRDPISVPATHPPATCPSSIGLRHPSFDVNETSQPAKEGSQLTWVVSYWISRPGEVMEIRFSG